MATRFYLNYSFASASFSIPSPSFDSAWERTTGVTRVPCFTSKNSQAFSQANVSTPTTFTPPYDVLCRQFISPPLAAQTISGDVHGQLRTFELSAADNAVYGVVIRVCSSDGSTFRGTLLSSFPESYTDSNEFSASALTNRYFPPLTAVSSVVAQEGDRLVIEIGCRLFNSRGSATTIGFRFGDNSASDLPENETSTDDYCPWVEFDTDIDFLDRQIVYHVLAQVEYLQGTTSLTTSASTSHSTSMSTSRSTSASTSATAPGETSASTSASTSGSTSASTSGSTSRSTSMSTSMSQTSQSTSMSTSRSTSMSTSASYPSTSASSSASSTASSSASTSLTTSASSSNSTSTATAPRLYPPFTFIEQLAEEPPVLRMVRLNRAGDDKDNPIISGVTFQITYYKHNATETFTSAQILLDDDSVFADLTSRCTETDWTVTVVVTAGTDLSADTPSVLNKIQFVTSNCTVTVGIWVSDDPAAALVLDGYMADAAVRPAIYRNVT